MDDYKYAIEWFAYGFNNHDEDIVKFMMYWIAFNWLYNASRYRYVPQEDENSEFSERELIEMYCEANMDALSHYGAFDFGYVDIFKEGAIIDCATQKEHSDVYDNLRYGTDSVKITSLILSIYYVRCNLFHGSKSIHNLRDRKLVKCSARILEGYLRVLLPSELLEEKLSNTNA